MLFWFEIAGLTILGYAVLWLLFSSAAKASKKIRDRSDDNG